jgi:hypothetical protein
VIPKSLVELFLARILLLKCVTSSLAHRSLKLEIEVGFQVVDRSWFQVVVPCSYLTSKGHREDLADNMFVLNY